MIRRFFLIFTILTSTLLTAQRSSSSPYSIFGIGEQFSPRTVEQASMGGIGVANSSTYYLNFINPASLADLRFTTYGFGLLNNDLTVDDGNQQQSSTSTSLSYIAIGVPIGTKGGISFGLQPLSSTGYSLRNDKPDPNTGDISERTIFEGEGGVNRLFLGFGYKVFKGFSLGLELDYAFGRNENGILKIRDDVARATKYEENANLRGTSVKFGAQYKYIFKNELELDAGLAVKLKNTLSATGNESLFSVTSAGNGAEIPRDELFNNSVTGEFISPAKTTLGFGLGKFNKWYFGTEYEHQAAIETNGFLSQTGTTFKFEDASRFSVGGFYLPKINSISSYFERVTYRAGLRFEKSGLLVDGTGTGNSFESIDDFGINIGLGLPLGKRTSASLGLSNINLGFEFGQRGTTNNNLIKENYFNLRLSLSLNDLWFQKRRID